MKKKLNTLKEVNACDDTASVKFLDPYFHEKDKVAINEARRDYSSDSEVSLQGEVTQEEHNGIDDFYSTWSYK